jgi:hypothetical protein
MIEGYRSGLEEKVAQQLQALGIPVNYETEIIEYTKPAKVHKYHPDFKLPNGIYIETKGRFVSADRQKHLLVKAQNPERDLRFVFSNSRGRISKQSQTTYADWCQKNGFKYADKLVPKGWIDERPSK